MLVRWIWNVADQATTTAFGVRSKTNEGGQTYYLCCAIPRGGNKDILF